MRIHYRKNKKHALFMSIELIVVLILVAVIVASVALGARSIMDQYSLFQVQNELSRYSEAMVKFKHTYGYWPGDVPVDKLTPEMNYAGMKDGISSATSSGESWAMMSSDVVLGIKSQLAFVQLVNAKIITSASLTSTYPNSVGTMTLAQAVTSYKVLPQASFNPDVAWYFMVDSNSYRNILSRSELPVLSIANGTYADNGVYSAGGANGGAYFKIWNNTPRLILFGWQRATNGTSARIWATDPLAAMEGKLAGKLDAKIDDGLPTGNNSKVVADNIRRTGGWKCTNYGVTNSALPPTYALHTTDQYSSFDTYGDETGCLMTFVIDYKE